MGEVPKKVIADSCKSAQTSCLLKRLLSFLELTENVSRVLRSVPFMRWFEPIIADARMSQKETKLLDLSCYSIQNELNE